MTDEMKNEENEQPAENGVLTGVGAPPDEIAEEVDEIMRNKNVTSVLFETAAVEKEVYDGKTIAIKLVVPDNIHARIKLKQLKLGVLHVLMFNPQLTLTGKQVDQTEAHGAEETEPAADVDEI